MFSSTNKLLIGGIEAKVVFITFAYILTHKFLSKVAELSSMYSFYYFYHLGYHVT